MSAVRRVDSITSPLSVINSASTLDWNHGSITLLIIGVSVALRQLEVKALHAQLLDCVRGVVLPPEERFRLVVEIELSLINLVSHQDTLRSLGNAPRFVLPIQKERVQLAKQILVRG